MSAQASFALRGRNPDVLTCIANLSNDEVFTPPEFANRMLDTLAEAWETDRKGANVWTDKTVRFLDPCTKSGVFLREITSRLTKGLAPEIPDLEERVNHILTKQVFGIGITYLTSLLARRSVYCSKHAKGKYSIAQDFASDAGNIWFERTEHTWADGKCTYCGASQKTFGRGEGLETHAYPFVHTDDAKTRIAELFGGDMQFDVIIGNPPYQLSTEGYGNQARPIYHQFVVQAKRLDPRYLVMVTPSRWFSGGMGLTEFREAMLSDKRMRSIVDYPKLYEGFPGVKIRGGISYFLWDREHNGPCSVTTIWDGKPTGPALSRHLDAYDILVRRNEAVPILEKVRAKGEPTLDARVSSQKPFGLATNFNGKPSKAGMKKPVRLFANQRIDWVDRSEILTNAPWIKQWKVLMTRIQGTSAAVETKFLSKPVIAGPGTACTETYIVAGHFDTEAEATTLAKYLRTRFVRFLISLRKSTQDALKSVYAFVPDLPLNQEWTDAKLYSRYGLTQDEIAFIESQVAEHDKERFEEAGAPEVDDE
ncbi:MAG: Eco57I restriction-modification methylase domain-containing protein [Candidatus Acidiferrales bacterium]